jgi:two-component system NtrC family sensor kinase
MSLLERLKPKFWDYKTGDKGPFKGLFNFRSMWKLAVFLMAWVAVVPLIALAVFDLNVTKNSTENEINLRISKFVSNAERTISFFLTERKYALDFIVKSNTFGEIADKDRLITLLEALKRSVGGFSDLGVIDHTGTQIRYVGPYDLEGKNYGDEEWFKEVLRSGFYISDVFLGFREAPHLVIAVKSNLPDGSFYVFRATLDTERFNKVLSQLHVSGKGDLFLINHDGIIQTPSIYYGDTFKKFTLPVPEYSDPTELFESSSPEGEPVMVGYAYVGESPFILISVNQKEELMGPWSKTRIVLFGFLAVCITIIVIVVVGVATFLVNEICMADQKRVMTLREVEHSSKLASIGRLAAGVAHEINNPLAIINEKAGLMKDLLSFTQECAKDERLIGLIDSILSSVERCGAITKRLLRFARHLDSNIEMVDIKSIIQDVLGFLDKEAEYRSIQIKVDVSDDIPRFESDRGKLQQIFLNLVNNAFAAMSDGGHLAISARLEGGDSVAVSVADDGCGIPKADLERIFEPFFSTKTKKGGTGLGLSITHGIVQELGGRVQVESEPGKGTQFIITVPLVSHKKET